MSDYPFRLLCKRCNSYLSTMIVRADEAIRLHCRKCGNEQIVAEELFGNRIEEDAPMDKLCSCGSGLPRREAVDARNIFLTFVCDSCEKRRLAAFRPEVLTDPNYSVLEPIDPE